MEESSWIEIISVRLFDSAQQGAVRDIFKQLDLDAIPNRDAKLNAELYVDHINDTDWSIYLYWTRQDGAPFKTLMGLGIAEAFSHMGLVHHSAWARDLARTDIDHETQIGKIPDRRQVNEFG
jgi:hypothetical protein